MSTLAMCIGGPAAGYSYETTGRDVLFVAHAPITAAVVAFAYRLAKIRVDGYEHEFWVPRGTPVDGEAAFVMGSLVGGYRAPGDR